MQSIEYDIVICGAGPGGSTCAGWLAKSGLRVAVIDRAIFPRDKVCGDAVPGRAIRELRKLGGYADEAFKQFDSKLRTYRTSLHYGERQLEAAWVGEAYTIARWDFDSFLCALAQAESNVSWLLGHELHTVDRIDGKFRLETNEGIISTKLLIAADGANSIVARKIHGRVLDRANHVGSVRAYYEGVSGVDEQRTEIWFDSRYLPSYLWIFPIAGGRVNVGFGMLSEDIARKKVDLKWTLKDVIDSNESLRARFANAKQLGPLSGFGLPLGGLNKSISGDGYMLVGDAASLIDPMTGDGIGNAMVSGRLAAEHALKCFGTGDFSSVFMKGYDGAVYRSLGKELALHRRVRRLLSVSPRMLDIVFWLGRMRPVAKMLQKAL